jgi:gamma-glutamyltranspeptidase/glutathione hydrolase
MHDFAWEFPYPSRRSPVLANNVVATSQPLAAQAGLRMLADGGNAVDAAVAAAIALTVVEPVNNGVGADAFAVVWDGEALHGLNASGRSPAAWERQRFDGCESMPLLGWDAVTVPGAVSAWVELSRRFGTLPLWKLFQPAIRYAREGFLVTPVIARQWGMVAGMYAEFPEFQSTYLPQGIAPRAGQLFRCPALAVTLELIADTNGDAFYRELLAAKIVSASRAAGGALDAQDLATHRCDWVGTISHPYAGFEVHEIPPNGQGIAALIALGILEARGLSDLAVDSADSVHLQIEAMKLALADTYRNVADPQAMEVDTAALLDRTYLEKRAASIDARRAGQAQHGLPAHGDTVYLSTGDAAGMMVSLIQSNYISFGSGVVIPGTGISMQNRAAGFSLHRGHPNEVAGGKRPFHTIIPGFLTRQGHAEMAFGVMGGPMQAQGHVQMLTRILTFRQNPQAAADAPRWQVLDGLEVGVEPAFPQAIASELEARGHRLHVMDPVWFGGAQMVCRTEGGYVAASDHRKDGQACGI